jgi:hypothetical protein
MLASTNWLDYKGEKDLIDLEELEDFLFLCNGRTIPIKYPTSTAALVIPINTVTVLAFLLFIHNQQNFFQQWVLFPVRKYPVDCYMSPFTSAENVFTTIPGKRLTKYTSGWDEQKKIADINELYEIWTRDSREHYSFVELADIVEKFKVFESFCQEGFIGFHLVRFVWPRGDLGPQPDDALFENRGGLASYVKDNSFINGIFVPRDHKKSNSDQVEEESGTSQGN